MLVLEEVKRSWSARSEALAASRSVKSQVLIHLDTTGLLVLRIIKL